MVMRFTPGGPLVRNSSQAADNHLNYADPGRQPPVDFKFFNARSPGRQDAKKTKMIACSFFPLASLRLRVFALEPLTGAGRSARECRFRFLASGLNLGPDS